MVIKIMTFQGNLIHASIEEAIYPSTILGKALNKGPIVGKAIVRGSILEQFNNFKSYCGKAINLDYWALSNYRLELTAAAGKSVRPRGLAGALCLEDLQSINPIRSYSSVFLAASRGSKVDDLFECECVLRIVGWSGVIADLPGSKERRASW